MALTINDLKGDKTMAGLTSDRRLYLAADKKTVVEADDERAAFLFAGAGSLISKPDADQYGLTEKNGKVVLVKPKTKEAPKPEAKETPKPEDKTKTPAENKSGGKK